ncbi:hypothetical protein BDR26DRAFT_983986 [Obelidium mucronatum]|nr:hypothetical protein BDR26DRAFT_983986 [Obelidium mucronatum]
MQPLSVTTPHSLPIHTGRIVAITSTPAASTFKTLNLAQLQKPATILHVAQRFQRTQLVTTAALTKTSAETLFRLSLYAPLLKLATTSAVVRNAQTAKSVTPTLCVNAQPLLSIHPAKTVAHTKTSVETQSQMFKLVQMAKCATQVSSKCECPAVSQYPAGKECGAYQNACGNTIALQAQASCTNGKVCNANFVCECPAVTQYPSGKTCGAYQNQCGNALAIANIGSCSNDQVCLSNQCVCPAVDQYPSWQRMWCLSKRIVVTPSALQAQGLSATNGKVCNANFACVNVPAVTQYPVRQNLLAPTKTSVETRSLTRILDPVPTTKSAYQISVYVLLFRSILLAKNAGAYQNACGNTIALQAQASCSNGKVCNANFVCECPAVTQYPPGKESGQQCNSDFTCSCPPVNYYPPGKTCGEYTNSCGNSLPNPSSCSIGMNADTTAIHVEIVSPLKHCPLPGQVCGVFKPNVCGTPKLDGDYINAIIADIAIMPPKCAPKECLSAIPNMDSFLKANKPSSSDLDGVCDNLGGLSSYKECIAKSDPNCLTGNENRIDTFASTFSSHCDKLQSKPTLEAISVGQNGAPIITLSLEKGEGVIASASISIDGGAGYLPLKAIRNQGRRRGISVSFEAPSFKYPSCKVFQIWVSYTVCRGTIDSVQGKCLGEVSEHVKPMTIDPKQTPLSSCPSVFNCGNFSDGCTTVSCGTCPNGTTCGLATANICDKATSTTTVATKSNTTTTTATTTNTTTTSTTTAAATTATSVSLSGPSDAMKSTTEVTASSSAPSTENVFDSTTKTQSPGTATPQLSNTQDTPKAPAPTPPQPPQAGIVINAGGAGNSKISFGSITINGASGDDSTNGLTNIAIVNESTDVVQNVNSKGGASHIQIVNESFNVIQNAGR